MEASDSDPSMQEYSDDTFAPLSDENEGEACGSYENDPFESYYSGETDGSYEKDSFESYSGAWDRCESTWQSPSSQNSEEPGTEFLNTPVEGEYLPRRWIHLLTNKRNGTSVSKTAIEPNKGASEGSEEEQGARQSFCTTKIKQLCRLPSSAPQKRRPQDDQRRGGSSEEKLVCDLCCAIPDQLANRLCLENIKETMKQIAEIKIHQPSKCFRCTEKKAELAESAFLRRRKALMEGVLLREKLEEHLYAKDAWGMCSLPKATRSGSSPRRHSRGIELPISGSSASYLIKRQALQEAKPLFSPCHY